jgi:hypothetical protein
MDETKLKLIKYELSYMAKHFERIERILSANESSSPQVAIAAEYKESDLVRVIVNFMSDKIEWKGTIAELREILNFSYGFSEFHKSNNSYFWRKIEGFRKTLEQHGIEVSKSRETSHTIRGRQVIPVFVYLSRKNDLNGE